jgi:transcriptional regulator with XRE-family HTH domain
MLSQAQIKAGRKYSLSRLDSVTYTKIRPMTLDIRRILSGNVKARMRGRTQAELAAHMNKTEAWASNFLRNKNAVPVVNLPALAEFCGCSVSDLFVDTTSVVLPTEKKLNSVHAPDGVTSSDRTMSAQSPSIVPSGEIVNARSDTQASPLSYRELEAKYEELRNAIEGWVAYFGSLVHKTTAGTTATQSKPGAAHRKHAREVPKYRRVKGRQ